MEPCTEEHYHPINCEHPDAVFVGMDRNRRGHYAGAIWVCKLCLHRLDSMRTITPSVEDIALFELEDA